MCHVIVPLMLTHPDIGFVFGAREGGTIDLGVLKGCMVLMVHTASLCGFTDQYADLQTLQKIYGERPDWNFNKMHLNPLGKIDAVERAGTRSMPPQMTRAIKAILTGKSPIP